MALTEKQEIGKQEIKGYIDGTKHQDKDYITISGQGGSGKTYLTNESLKPFKKQKIMGGAISNSACEVLSKNIPFADVQTLTKLLKEQLITDKNTGQQRFETITPYLENIPITQAQIIPIDECSMIGKERLKNIIKYKQDDAKLIFLGDIVQLSVIESGEISPVFNNIVIELDEVMRSKEPLDDINNYLRTNILSLIYHNKLINPEILSTKMSFPNKRIKDSGYYNIKDEATFIKQYLGRYEQDSENPLGSKIIAYTNKSVQYYNNLIRTKLYGVGANKYIIGDKLITDKPYIDDDIYIPTNTYLTVNAINKGEFEEIQVYFLDLSTNNSDYFGIPIIDYNNSNDYAKYKIKLSKLEMKAKARKIKWTKVNEFKNSFASVSFSYSVSSHKSQGQGFKNAFVCESEIKSLYNPSALNKLQSIYVATSRAENDIYLF